MDEFQKNKKEELLKKQYSKGILNKYLIELQSICLCKFDLSNIIEIAKTNDIINYRKKKELNQCIKKTISFEQKQYLKDIIELIWEYDKRQIYVFTDYSKVCGAGTFKSIKCFNHNFNFEDEHAGLISLISADMENRLLLDFFEKNHNLYLEIEIEGNLWTNIPQIGVDYND